MAATVSIHSWKIFAYQCNCLYLQCCNISYHSGTSLCSARARAFSLSVSLYLVLSRACLLSRTPTPMHAHTRCSARAHPLFVFLSLSLSRSDFLTLFVFRMLSRLLCCVVPHSRIPSLFLFSLFCVIFLAACCVCMWSCVCLQVYGCVRMHLGEGWEDWEAECARARGRKNVCACT